MTSIRGQQPAAGFHQVFKRGRDIPVSPADTLDAVQAASLLGYEDRTIPSGTALQRCWQKAVIEELTYREAFDIFFAPARQH